MLLAGANFIGPRVVEVVLPPALPDRKPMRTGLELDNAIFDYIEV